MFNAVVVETWFWLLGLLSVQACDVLSRIVRQVIRHEAVVHVAVKLSVTCGVWFSCVVAVSAVV